VWTRNPILSSNFTFIPPLHIGLFFFSGCLGLSFPYFPFPIKKIGFFPPRVLSFRFCPPETVNFFFEIELQYPPFSYLNCFPPPPFVKRHVQPFPPFFGPRHQFSPFPKGIYRFLASNKPPLFPFRFKFALNVTGIPPSYNFMTLSFPPPPPLVPARTIFFPSLTLTLWGIPFFFFFFFPQNTKFVFFLSPFASENRVSFFRFVLCCYRYEFF